MFDLSKPVIGYTDGGSRPNPGPSAFGVVFTQNEQEQLTAKCFIGEATSNIAEYSGLLYLLTKAHELGIRSLEVRMDSELIVMQMLGKYKVRNAGLMEYHKQCTELAAKFLSFRITHVRREYNKLADQLANEALDEALGTTKAS